MTLYTIYGNLPLRLKNLANNIFIRALQPRMKKHFSKFIRPGDLVFDVGSYKGELTQIFLELGARVICIEPQPVCVKKLTDKYQDNPQVRVIDKGISDRKGKHKLLICVNSKTNSTFSKQWIKHSRYNQRRWEKKVEVEVTTLQSLIEDVGKPRFCKIDVEGFEDRAIGGLKTSIPYLSFEFDQEFIQKAELCIERLASLGDCLFNYSKYFNYSLESDKWLSSQDLMSSLESEMNGYLRGDIYAKYL